MRNKKNKAIKIIMIILTILIIIIGIVLKNINEENKKKNEISNLTQEELQYFTEYLNKEENNGFLLSEYNNADEIDLSKVLYSGAGVKEKMNNEETKDYLKAINEKQLYVNVTAIATNKIEELFKEKTGEDLKEITKKLKDWTYLEKYNKYYLAHGDTSYTKITCEKGYVQDNKYVVYCAGKNGAINSCRVTLEKQGDKYIFKENVV